jgi:hypothetical protein
MNAIETWFKNSTPYDEGVLIFETIPGHNKVLLKNFKRKKSIQLHEKLKYELRKFLKEINAPAKKEVQKIGQIFKDQNFSKVSVVQYIEQSNLEVQQKQAIYFHELPTELRPFLLEANTLFKEMCFLKVQLNEIPAHAEEKALEIQIAINAKQKANANSWKKIDYWQKHKVAPTEKPSEFLKLAPAELLRKEQYLFAAISKLNKRLQLNREASQSVTLLKESNRISNAIRKQENNLIIKNDELQKIKALIHGK